ncbi:hypothetical protein [Dubosiella newyorkensis]|nr:hypothetical protein [Dubosiella newyorkensis]
MTFSSCVLILPAMSKRSTSAIARTKKPLYLLPIRMYGPVDVQELYYDIQDILIRFKENPINPVHFPDEENCLKVKRVKAYRNVKKS